MSRGLSTPNLNASIAEALAPVVFAELQFDSGTVRVHSRLGTFTWGGHDWLGVGMFGSVSTVEESSDMSRRTVTYSLSGIPGDLISVVLDEHYQGNPAKLYLGFLDAQTSILLADPELLDHGRMDVSRISESETCAVTITAESRFAAWERPQIRRYTDADQQNRFPGDRGLEFVNAAAQQEIVWGRG